VNAQQWQITDRYKYQLMIDICFGCCGHLGESYIWKTGKYGVFV